MQKGKSKIKKINFQFNRIVPILYYYIVEKHISRIVRKKIVEVVVEKMLLFTSSIERVKYVVVTVHFKGVIYICSV